MKNRIVCYDKNVGGIFMDTKSYDIYKKAAIRAGITENDILSDSFAKKGAEKHRKNNKICGFRTVFVCRHSSARYGCVDRLDGCRNVKYGQA